MGSRIGFMLLMLVISCTYAQARSLVTLDIKGDHNRENRTSKLTAGDGNFCTLCEEYTAEALEYLKDNDTQNEIINVLHDACSQLQPFKHECVVFVDYYVPLFFNEVATIEPEKLCEKVNLCEMFSVHLPKRDDACTLCHNFVAQILVKLKDPDTQLEVIEMLLKSCSKVQNFVQQCKELVFQYGPLILVNAEKFFETNDICVALHTCKASQKVVVVELATVASA